MYRRKVLNLNLYLHIDAIIVVCISTRTLSFDLRLLFPVFFLHYAELWILWDFRSLRIERTGNIGDKEEHLLQMKAIADGVLNVSRNSGLSEYANSDNVYVSYDQRPETYIVPVVFSLILIVGVMGNGILILILLCHPNMRNVPNIYVLSLAIGDLLVSIYCINVIAKLYRLCPLSHFYLWK